MQKKTAVEWLVEQVNADCLNSTFIRKELIDQAKATDREHILGFVNWIAKDWVSVLISGKWMWMNVDALRPNSQKHNDMYYTDEELYKIYLQDERHKGGEQ